MSASTPSPDTSCQAFSATKASGFSSTQGQEARFNPMHMHAEKGEKSAKIWLVPATAIASSYGFNRKEQAELVRIVAERRDEIERKWHECFR